MSRHDKALELFAKGGVIPAIPLAINEDRTYNEKGQRLLTRYYLESGVDGIAIAVHTTQFEIRDPKYNLFERVLKTVAQEIADFEQKTGAVVIKVAGACGEISQAVNEAKIAGKHGFDAILLSPGGLSDKDESYLLERTAAVSMEMPVIGFYLQSAAGGRRFSYDYWEKLCAIPNVVGIKCASFNRYTTIDVARAVAFSPRASKITLYTGNDDNIVVDLLTPYKFTRGVKTYTAQFKGGLLGHWSVWTHRVVELFALIKKSAGQAAVPAELLTLAAEITDANGVFFDAANNFEGCIPGVHEILHRQGLMEGVWCLNPKETLSVGQSEEIDRIYEMYPHLNDDEFVAENLERLKSS